MRSLLVISTVIASLQATGEFGRGVFTGISEPVVMALWGITLLSLATSTRNTLRRNAHTKKPS
jgi:hypothetical protein